MESINIRSKRNKEEKEKNYDSTGRVPRVNERVIL
jgi:hypothetical protein